MDNKISKLVGQISELAFKLNHIKTKRETTGNKPTVFISFNGHVCDLEVDIYYNGWFPYSEDCKRFDIDLSKSNAENKLKEPIKILKELIEEWC